MQTTRLEKRLLQVDDDDRLKTDAHSADRAGFSLIELLAVMSLVALLAAIAAPRYVGFKDRAYISIMAGDLYHLRLVQELHRREGQRPYVDDLAQFGDAFQPSPEVQITIFSADAEGYAATATHTGTKKVCVYTTDDAVTSCGPGSADLTPTPSESQTVPQPDSALGIN